MSLRVKSINADACFLLTFTPPPRPDGSSDEPYNVLVDPWLTGASTVISTKFAHSYHTARPCVESLRHLPEPDLVIVSQDMPDHCHQETLRQMSPDTAAKIVAPSSAAKRIQGWRHFAPDTVHALPRYDSKRPENVCRIAIPSAFPIGSSGEITIASIAPKLDLKGMHNAIGITYRPPLGPALSSRSYVQLPISPPATPDRELQTTLCPSPLDKPRGKTLSVLYSPHGVDYKLVKPYASNHLLKEAALPLSVLLHSMDRVSNPWFLGGTICAGSPGGVELARNLYAKHWISAHDEEKVNSGLSTKTLRCQKFDADGLGRLLAGRDVDEKRSGLRTEVHSLDAGQEFRLVVA